VEKDELEKFIQANTQELGKEKWLCPLSNKKFKGAEFVRKHIFNKHAEKVAAVKADVEFFNNFLRDPRRPQLPEKPKPKPQPTAAAVVRPQEPAVAAERRREEPRPQHRKGSIKDRLGYRSAAMRVTHSAADPRGMVDYSDVDFPGLDDLF
jgi:Arsenite-resistance protein 2